MQYVSCLKKLHAVYNWAWGFTPEARKFSTIFVLKVNLQSIRLLLTVKYRKLGEQHVLLVAPNNFVGEATLLPPVPRVPARSLQFSRAYVACL